MYVLIYLIIFDSLCLHCTEVDPRTEPVSIKFDLVFSLIVDCIADLFFKFSENIVKIDPDSACLGNRETNACLGIKGIRIVAPEIVLQGSPVSTFTDIRFDDVFE